MKQVARGDFRRERAINQKQPKWWLGRAPWKPVQHYMSSVDTCIVGFFVESSGGLEQVSNLFCMSPRSCPRVEYVAFLCGSV